jgi:hypothetical protein
LTGRPLARLITGAEGGIKPALRDEDRKAHEATREHREAAS